MAPSKVPSLDPPMRPRRDIAFCLASRWAPIPRNASQHLKDDRRLMDEPGD